VDAEPNWDGLIFYVDGVVLLPKISVTNVYVDFAANLSAGYPLLSPPFSHLFFFFYNSIWLD
jgi:hypothetical protein